MILHAARKKKRKRIEYTHSYIHLYIYIKYIHAQHSIHLYILTTFTTTVLYIFYLSLSLSEHTRLYIPLLVLPLVPAFSTFFGLSLSLSIFLSTLLMALQFSPEQPGQWGQRLVLFAEELNRDSGESRGAKYPPDFKADAGCPVYMYMYVVHLYHSLVPGHKLSSMQPGTN